MTGINVDIDFEVVCVLILIILFWGTPDLHDRLIGGCDGVKVEVIDNKKD